MVVITIKGQHYYLWRAVDAEGQVLDVWMPRHNFGLEVLPLEQDGMGFGLGMVGR